MTPMVDLGFLLISFFIFTTELSKPVVVNLAMPKDSSGPPIPLGESNALTVILSNKDKIFYYEGEMNQAISNGKISETNYSTKEGIRKIIRNKQEWLDKANISKEKRDGLMVLIKADSEASYENLMAVLDEMLINNVKRYALIKLEPGEINWLKGKL